MRAIGCARCHQAQQVLFESDAIDTHHRQDITVQGFSPPWPDLVTSHAAGAGH